MARNPELDNLRAELLKRHRAVTAKISRMRTRSGVDLGRTKEDPRVYSPGELRQLNMRDAKRQLGKLNAFMARENAYIASKDGKPIHKSQWGKYALKEQRNKELGEIYFDGIKNVRLRNGQTVEEYRAEQQKKGSNRMGFLRGNRVYIEGQRKVSNINGAAALDKLIKDIDRRNTKRYPREAIKNARKNMVSMLEGGGINPDIVKEAKKLTNYQVDLLMHHTKFAQDAGEHYFFLSNENEGGTVKPTSTHAEREKKLHEDIEWAAKLKPEPVQEPQAAESQSSRRRRR